MNTQFTSIESSATPGRELEEMLILLSENLPRVPTLNRFVKDSHPVPSVIFTSSSISECVDALNGSVDLTSDCIIFSDLIRLYSFNYFSDVEGFYTIIRSVLMSSRCAPGHRPPVYSEAVDDFSFQDNEQLRNFLLDNELLVVIYVVSMIKMILPEE